MKTIFTKDSAICRYFFSIEKYPENKIEFNSKILLLLSLQMGFTSILLGLISTSKLIRQFLEMNPTIGYMCGFVSIILIHVVSFCSSSKRRTINWVLTVVLTILGTITISVIALQNHLFEVLLFLSVCAFNFFVLFLFFKKPNAIPKIIPNVFKLSYLFMLVSSIFWILLIFLIFKVHIVGVVVSVLFSCLLCCFYVFDSRWICDDPKLGGRGLTCSFLSFNLHLEFQYLFLLKLVFLSLCRES